MQTEVTHRCRTTAHTQQCSFFLTLYYSGINVGQMLETAEMPHCAHAKPYDFQIQPGPSNDDLWEVNPSVRRNMDPFSIGVGASFGAGVSFGASVSFRAGLVAPSSAATSAAAAAAAAYRWVVSSSGRGGSFCWFGPCLRELIATSPRPELQQRGGRESSKLRASWPLNVRGFGQRGLWNRLPCGVPWPSRCSEGDP